MAQVYVPSVLQDVFGFRGFKVTGIRVDEAEIRVLLGRSRRTGCCPICSRRRAPVREEYERRVRDLDVSGRECYVVFQERLLRCRCGFRGVEKLDWVDKHSRCSMRLEDFVARLCRMMDLKAAAEITRLDWKTVKNIDKKYLARLIPDLHDLNPTRIGVDEIAHLKGHHYLTVVRDVDTGQVIWVGDKRKKDTLDRFFQKLGAEKSRRIKVAVLDMWDPYLASIHEHTNAEIVFDKFHLAKKINQAVDDLRKQEFRQATPRERKQMKKKRFLILYRKKNLAEDKHQELDTLLEQNQTLYTAYLLKEQVLDILDEENPETAVKRLHQWIENTWKSGLTQFDRVIKTIQTHWTGVTNYFKHHVTNATSEAINNKINIIKRRSYGFHDTEYFKLKIYQTTQPK